MQTKLHDTLAVFFSQRSQWNADGVAPNGEETKSNGKIYEFRQIIRYISLQTCFYEEVSALSNGDIADDLEWFPTTPSLTFKFFLHISEMAEARVFKFCTLVDIPNVRLGMTNYLSNGQGDVTHF